MYALCMNITVIKYVVRFYLNILFYIYFKLSTLLDLLNMMTILFRIVYINIIKLYCLEKNVCESMYILFLYIFNFVYNVSFLL